MGSIPVFQIDAFTNRRFSGNPAAVCLLEQDASVEWMQAVAQEMNLAETAFVRSRDEDFELRWFTPAIEVDLCGHATLAAAHALWTQGVVDPAKCIRFQTKSGVLECVQRGETIELDFPATPAQESEPPAGLLECLGIQPVFVGQTKFDYMVAVESEDQVRGLNPDFSQLGKVATRGIMVTSPASDPQIDFVSRFFAPRAGINEDPVTGSAHCCLGPYWGAKLGKTELTAYQASTRGGTLRLRLVGDRVVLAGQAVTVLKGELV